VLGALPPIIRLVFADSGVLLTMLSHHGGVQWVDAASAHRALDR